MRARPGVREQPPPLGPKSDWKGSGLSFPRTSGDEELCRTGANRVGGIAYS